MCLKERVKEKEKGREEWRKTGGKGERAGERMRKSCWNTVERHLTYESSGRPPVSILGFHTPFCTQVESCSCYVNVRAYGLRASS
jgi:hypothetical protein